MITWQGALRARSISVSSRWGWMQFSGSSKAARLVLEWSAVVYARIRSVPSDMLAGLRGCVRPRVRSHISTLSSSRCGIISWISGIRFLSMSSMSAKAFLFSR